MEINVSEWINKGVSLTALNRHEEALIAYDKVLLVNPNHIDALYNKGVSLTALNRYEEALIAYDTVFLINPNHVSALYNKGVSLNTLNRYEEALIAYDTVLLVSPNHIDALYNKGVSLNTLNRYEEALVALNQALAINSNDVSAWINKGVSLIELNRPEEALVALDKALAIDPNYVSAWVNKGVSLNALNRPEEALVALDKALAIDPNHVHALYNKGVSLNAMNRPEEALVALDKALAINSNHVLIWEVKINVSSQLVNTSHTILQCLTHIYFLSKSYKRYAELLPYIKTIDSPLLLFEITRYNPNLQTSYYWQEFVEPIFNRWDYILYKFFLSCNSSELSDKKIASLLAYYLGNMVNSYELCNEIDDDNERDLQNQYYLICSLQGCVLDFAKELEFAKKIVLTEYDSNSILNYEDAYYAGQILTLDRDFENASKYYEMSIELNSDFLPSYYMNLFCRSNLAYPNQSIIDSILKLEYCNFEKGNFCYLKPIVTMLDVNSEEWLNQLHEYLHYQEVLEGIFYVFNFLEYKETDDGSIPNKLKWIDSNTYSNPYNQGTILFNNIKHDLSIKKPLKELVDKVNIDALKLFPSNRITFPETNVDDFIINLIREQGWSERNKKYYQALVFYAFFNDNITIEDCLSLILYIHLKTTSNLLINRNVNDTIEETSLFSLDKIIEDILLIDSVTLKICTFGVSTILLQVMKSIFSTMLNKKIGEYNEFKKSFHNEYRSNPKYMEIINKNLINLRGIER